MGVALGILSTARINDKLLAGAAESPLVDVAAVASRERARAERYARARGIERAHGSYEALLEDPAVELVYVSLPNRLHVEWTLRALEAGKHVLCEKPLSPRPEAVEQVFDAADRAGRLVMEGFMYRHHPQIARLLGLVEDGAIGRLLHVRSAFSFTASDPRDVRLQVELEGGSLMDVGCYCLSASRLLAGEPLRVYAEQVTSEAGIDLRLAATMRMPQDVLAELDCGLAGGDRDELEVVGSEASVFLDDPWHGVDPVLELRRPDGVERIACERANPYRLELDNLCEAIRGRAAPLLGRADALGQARGIAALLRSARTGQPVELAAA